MILIVFHLLCKLFQKVLLLIGLEDPLLLVKCLVYRGYLDLINLADRGLHL